LGGLLPPAGWHLRCATEYGLYSPTATTYPPLSTPARELACRSIIRTAIVLVTIHSNVRTGYYTFCRTLPFHIRAMASPLAFMPCNNIRQFLPLPRHPATPPYILPQAFIHATLAFPGCCPWRVLWRLFCCHYLRVPATILAGREDTTTLPGGVYTCRCGLPPPHLTSNLRLPVDLLLLDSALTPGHCCIPAFL